MPLSLEARMQRLERSLARWKWGSGLLACSIAAMLVGVRLPVALAGPPDALPTDVVRARKFEVVDKTGRAVAVLTSEDWPRLSFLGAKSEELIGVALAPGNRPQISVRAPQGGTRASLDLSTDGLPSFQLFDTQGRTRVLLSAGDHRELAGGKGGGWIALTGPAREARVLLGIEGDETPHLEVLAPDGTPIWKAPSK